MKSFRRPACAIVLALLTAATGSTALAQPHGGHVRFGVYVGAPFRGPAYYPPYYYPRPYYAPSYYAPYYPPVVVAPPAPPVYLERGAEQSLPAPASAQQNWWYYCNESRAYYPYARDCPAGWQRVAPQPQG